MEITVIGDSGIVGWVAGATRTGEIYAVNTRDMVTKVLTVIGVEKISRLNILDHNAKTSTKLAAGYVKSLGIEIGKDIINEHNVQNFKSLLLLKGRFTSDGFVHLQHCNIGKNQELMKKLATHLAVPVYAGTGAHNPLLRVNYGKYVRCEPTGVCQTDVSRP